MFERSLAAIVQLVASDYHSKRLFPAVFSDLGFDIRAKLYDLFPVARGNIGLVVTLAQITSKEHD